MKRGRIDSIVIRLKEDDKTVGYLDGHYSWSSRYGWAFHIDEVRVPKNKRKQGIGRKLLSMIPRKAFLCASPLDGSCSVKELFQFYRKCGFKQIEKGSPCMIRR